MNAKLNAFREIFPSISVPIVKYLMNESIYCTIVSTDVEDSITPPQLIKCMPIYSSEYFFQYSLLIFMYLLYLHFNNTFQMKYLVFTAVSQILRQWDIFLAGRHG